MEGFMWNDMQNYNSNEESDLESYADISQWDENLYLPTGHPQHHDQDIQRQQEIHNMQSTQSCEFSQQSTLPPTMNVSLQNQMSPQCIQKHLQHQNLQSIPPSPLCPLGQLPPTERQVSFQNQLIPQEIERQQEIQTMQSTQCCASLHQSSLPPTMHSQDSLQNQMSPQPLQKHLQHQDLQSMQPVTFWPPRQLPPNDDQLSIQNQMTHQLLQDHLQHKDLQSMQPSTLYPPRQLPPNDGHLSTQNQEHLQRNSMYGVSQYPQHLTEQVTLSVPKSLSSSQAVVDMLPVSTLTQQQYHQHIQEQLPPKTPPRTFLQLLAQSLISSPTSGLSKINQGENPSSQMNVVHQPPEPNPDQITEEVMRQYASTFKKWRIMLDFRQTDVVLELFQMYEKKVSLPQISRFESFNLSLERMCDLKLLLDRWLANIEASLRTFQSLITKDCDPLFTMKYITTWTTRQVLEKAFLQNPNPAVEETEKLAKSLIEDNEFVSIWFCNRREVLNSIQSLTVCTMEPKPETKDRKREAQKVRKDF